MNKLSKKMSVADFDANYYYAEELKIFARSIGIQVGNFRKNELEELIKEYLITGKVPSKKPTLPRNAGESRDVLSPRARVKNYVGDRQTKDFLLQLVRNKKPDIKDKSGQWYWLNDWRRSMQEREEAFTYAKLANKLFELMNTDGRLPQIPSARYNNFLSDYLANESAHGKTRADAMKAWKRIRKEKGQKTYVAFKKLKNQ